MAKHSYEYWLCIFIDSFPNFNLVSKNFHIPKAAKINFFLVLLFIFVVLIF